MIICTLFSYIIFFGASYALYHEYHLELNHVETIGHIIDKESGIRTVHRRKSFFSQKEPYYKISYLFIASDKKEYVNKIEVSQDFFNQAQKGDTVSVYFLPDNPEWSRITQQDYSKVLMGISSCSFFGFVLCCLFMNLKFSEIKKYLICKNGIITDAVISNIYYYPPERSINNINYELYDITYEFYDTYNVSHEILLMSQVVSRINPVKFEKYQKIKIIYSIQNPKKNFIVFPKKMDIKKYIT